MILTQCPYWPALPHLKHQETLLIAFTPWGYRPKLGRYWIHQTLSVIARNKTGGTQNINNRNNKKYETVSNINNLMFAFEFNLILTKIFIGICKFSLNIAFFKNEKWFYDADPLCVTLTVPILTYLIGWRFFIQF